MPRTSANGVRTGQLREVVSALGSGPRRPYQLRPQPAATRPRPMPSEPAADRRPCIGSGDLHPWAALAALGTLRILAIPPMDGHTGCHRAAGTIYGMQKTTVYLPEELDLRLKAEAEATGVSKAELIRRGLAALLEASDRPKRSGPLPVFDSGRPRTADELDDELVDHLKSRAARR